MNQMADLTDLELDVKRTLIDVGVVSIRLDPGKSTMWRDSARGAIAE